MVRLRKIHFVGVKGVGMAPLAIIAKEAGMEVTGSDIGEEFITDKGLKSSGVVVLKDFDPQRIDGVDLVITTSAHQGFDNPEVKEAIQRNIPVLIQGEALGKFMSGEILGKKFEQIAVAGSHGKTTTTAMIASLLTENKLDPSYSIGTGEVPNLGSSGHFGKGKYFVAEADEYFADPLNNRVPKFLFFNPKIAIVTNVDFDHPDIYESVEDVVSAFVELTKKITKDGVLIACGDGDLNRQFLSKIECRKITFGLSPQNDYVLTHVESSPDKTFFRVQRGGINLGEFSLKVIGEQNALNATAALVTGFELGLTQEQIKKGLSAFSGSKRRSEYIGELTSGAMIFDDYAHHPAEIKATLQAFRKTYPKKRIICVFQPHMYSRTVKFFKEFAASFAESDLVLIPEIFPSFREKPDPNFSSLLLAQEVNKMSKEAKYFPNFSDVVKYLASQKMDKNTLVITMGAGDVYKIGQALIKGVEDE
jgi:UDP-N-acetylmuramate--alanine ligase